METRKLTLIRGVSGSGKSTMAHKILPNGPVIEADQYFINSKGIYEFKANLLPSAHEWCQFQAESQMASNCPHIIVANTFVREWEMEQYFALAEEYNYDVELLTTPEPWDAEILFERNVHNVPLETIKRQIAGFQRDIKIGK